MSKGRCERDLEEMTAERNHWLKLAQERTEQLGDVLTEMVQLRDALATQRDDAALIGGEGGLLNGIREQRDNWRRRAEEAMERATSAETDVQRLVTAIEDFRNKSRWYYDHILSDQDFAVLAEVAEQRSLPAVAAAVWEVGATVIKVSQEQHERSRQSALQKLGLADAAEEEKLNAHLHPGISLAQAWESIFNAGVVNLASALVMQAYGIAHDPRLVADMILRECRTKGEPSMKTISWLPDGWITNNLPNPPAKNETLQEALRVLREEELSGLNRRQFAAKCSLDERTLRLWQSWKDALEKIATMVPDEVKPFIKDSA